MMIHFSTERVRNSFGEKGFKVYLMTESFALVFKKNALDRSGSIAERFTGVELNFGRNNDINPYRQRRKPFLKLKRLGWTKPNKGVL